MIVRFAIAALAWATPAWTLAQIVSPAPDAVRVTIYRSNADEAAFADLDEYDDYYDYDDEPSWPGLVMVSETRAIDLPTGESTLVFRGVADAIVPQTAALEDLSGVVLESNYQYDLLTPGAMLAHSHGERVRWVRTGPKGEISDREAILRSGPDGVLLDVDGAIEALDCSGGAEKLVFARIPPQLASEPTLSMRVRTDAAGPRTVRLSYLALGLNWKADYVATLNLDGRTLDLTGWITLINRSSTTFADTPAEVVAGELAHDGEETQPPEIEPIDHYTRCWPVGSFIARLPPALQMSAPAMAMRLRDGRMLEEVVVTARMAAPLAKLSELGDYKLYTLPHPTTVAARQSKQVRFLERRGVKYERVYKLTLDAEALDDADDHTPPDPSIVLRIPNTKRAGLGAPLPAGRIAVMEHHEMQEPLFAGRPEIQDTPVDLPLDLAFGEAIDVRIEPRLMKVTEHVDSEGRPFGRAELEVQLTNGKPFPALLEYRHPMIMEAIDSSFQIIASSHRYEAKDGAYLWSFRLPPGATKVLRYKLEAQRTF